MNAGPGPLRLSPVSLGKVWAKPELPSDLAGPWPTPPGTGEIWLASDRGRVTPVAAGPLAGLGLDEVMRRHGRWVLGHPPEDGFPLLLKILNIGQWLSVQVHPDDATARRLEGDSWGKTEAWHVLEAGPGASIILGLPSGGRGGIVPALEAGRLGEILPRVAVRAGETYLLPAGLLHAPGPDLAILEIQQTSDRTYRLYDWDRPGDDGRPRELHVEKALTALKDAPPPPVVPPPAVAGRARLAACEYFQLWRTGLEPGGRDFAWPRPGGTRARLVVVLAGGGRLEADRGDWPAEELAPGQTWLLPAGLSPHGFVAGAQGLVMFEGLPA